MNKFSKNSQDLERFKHTFSHHHSQLEIQELVKCSKDKMFLFLFSRWNEREREKKMGNECTTKDEKHQKISQNASTTN